VTFYKTEFYQKFYKTHWCL